MPNYNQAHAFYAGVDLHARSMFVHILNAKGKTVFERDLPAEPDLFLDAVQPFRKNLVVGCAYAQAMNGHGLNTERNQNTKFYLHSPIRVESVFNPWPLTCLAARRPSADQLRPTRAVARPDKADAGLDSCAAGRLRTVTLRGSSPSFCVTGSSARRGF